VSSEATWESPPVLAGPMLPETRSLVEQLSRSSASRGRGAGSPGLAGQRNGYSGLTSGIRDFRHARSHGAEGSTGHAELGQATDAWCAFHPGANPPDRKQKKSLLARMGLRQRKRPRTDS
jgi:hypothetical protein